jgi:poly(hydroxyalkanoate) granule-associated protein
MPAKKAKPSARKGKAVENKKKTDDRWTWLDILRTPILASVGAFSIAEEGIEKFIDELVERGEASEKEGKKIAADFRKRTRRNRRDLEKGIDQRIQKTLKAFRLPTKQDVASLTRKIGQLEKKVNKLAKQGS